jgi:alanyl-tRNA synthetase
MITSQLLRSQFLEFYRSKNHTIIPSAPLIPKEDPTLLFVNSGMYPLVPYLMGQEHPEGNRLADSQKVIRTVDIDEVGDNRHLSFFEMLGSWSLGDYSKEDSINWGFEFLTSKDWLGLDPRRLFVTVYKGGDALGEDSESIQAWSKCFESTGITADVGVEFNFKGGFKINSEDVKTPSVPAGHLPNRKDSKYIYRITKKSGADNWWGLPYLGPCGPCSEIYYLLDKNELEFESQFESMDLTAIEDFVENQIVEIWNHVFMEYQGEWGDKELGENSKEPKNLTPLAKKNVDTGMGFERLLMILQNVDTVQETDVLKPIADVVKKWGLKSKV